MIRFQLLAFVSFLLVSCIGAPNPSNISPGFDGADLGDALPPAVFDAGPCKSDPLRHTLAEDRAEIV